jgi:hypothetical protein
MTDDTQECWPDDIVKRLRRAAVGLDMNQTAADEIERLRALVDAIGGVVAAYMNQSIGSSLTIHTISLLLDSEEARRD